MEYAKHKDTFETYQNLSMCAAPHTVNITDHYPLGTFLLNNYKQALKILDMRSAVDTALVKVSTWDMDMVKEWLKEEEEYLRGLSKRSLLSPCNSCQARPSSARALPSSGGFQR